MGLTRAAMTPANVARAAVEGMLCGLADGVDALARVGVPVRRAVLIGGAARSAAVRAVAATVLGVPVVVPEPAEYVALGAARQAAWALIGSAAPPAWPGVGRMRGGESSPDGRGDTIRAAYAHWRDFVYQK
jgi:xylulokinase